MSKKFSPYVPLFSATLCLSAFLLFFIQPMYGKMILPLMGGAPAVWNTAMVFFQAALLAGYAWAHLISRLPTWIQGAIQIAVLFTCSIFLPIALPAGWEPPATTNPAFWQLALMAVSVGGPFFVLAGTAPMLQNWFARTGHKDAHNPYFLYAASNLGSMAALISYPFLVEPVLGLKLQAQTWANGYWLLTACIAACAFFASKGKKPESRRRTTKAVNDDMPSLNRIGLWLLLAFIPSSLMMGVTTYITTDVASMPLFWVIPLALYVGTFIIAFAKNPPITLEKLHFAQALALVAVILVSVKSYQINLWIPIILHLGLFFLTAQLCHSSLAEVRPSARHLTMFYLIMSTGGVLGGIFNALIAPNIFTIPFEYPLVLALATFMRFRTAPGQSWLQFKKNMKPEIFLFPMFSALIVALIISLDTKPTDIIGAFLLLILLFMIHEKRWIFAFSVAAVFALYPAYSWRQPYNSIQVTRNYFGVLRVAQDDKLRILVHGTTMHGAQPLDPHYKLVPNTYYYTKAPAGNIFGVLDTMPLPQNIAILGLGTGGLVCYANKRRHFDYYEIDPDVVKVAEDTNFFTYLSDCGSPYDTVLGDARLKLEKAPDHSYDAIIGDAFSSDNIPTHLLTKEAFELYLRKLKPGGFIVVHISNRYLNLRPLLAATARDLNLAFLAKSMNGGMIEGTDIPFAASIFVVMAPDPATLDPFLKNYKNWKPVPVAESEKSWTDDYSNIIGAISKKQRENLDTE